MHERLSADLIGYVGSADILHFMQFVRSAVMSKLTDPITDVIVMLTLFTDAPGEQIADGLCFIRLILH